MKFSLQEITETVSGELSGIPEEIIDSIVIDSRKTINSSHTLFIAINGERNDGHVYIPELIKKGVHSFLVEYIPEGLSLPGISYILVKDSVHALQKIAACQRSLFQGSVIAITGSNGKTVVKEWIAQSIGDRENVVRSPQSYNSQVGVPLSLFLLHPGADFAIIEAGISKAGEMSRLQKIILPDVGIMTNIGSAHQENFGSLEEKIREKLKLFSSVSKLIYCSDYPLVHKIIQEQFSREKRISWGVAPDNDYQVEKVYSEEGYRIRFRGKKRDEMIVPFKDMASVENCIHTMVFLYEQGYKSSLIISAVQRLEPVSMRMEILRGANHCTLINDGYNSDPGSLSNALDYLDLQVQHPRKTLILSDILQTGETKSLLYKSISTTLGKRNINRVIAIGEELWENRNFFSENAHFFIDTDSFLRQISGFHFQDEAILIKGARKFQFERITSSLQELAHRTVMEIDLTRVLDNYRVYRSLLKPDVKMMVMVKAFSYGNGGYEIANLLQYQHVEYLAVAYADEGVLLRKGGIRTPVMVMNPEKSDFNLISEYHLEPEIYSFRIFNLFEEYLSQAGVDSYPVHIKLDTGMHRLGFDEKDVPNLIERVKSSRMRVVSVFSHLACSDDSEQDDFTQRQIQLFSNLCRQIKGGLDYAFLRHILNTSGIERFEESQFDMVRLGIGLYGLSESGPPGIKEVSAFKTRISQIRYVKKGDTVGYGKEGKVLRSAKIAVVPVGYADGIPRSLSNGVGKFMINHQLVPLIGNVCMDMCMLDITDIEAEEEDEVLIFGKEHSVRNLARYSNTIVYEIIAGISRRVKRVYYQE